MSLEHSFHPPLRGVGPGAVGPRLHIPSLLLALSSPLSPLDFLAHIANFCFVARTALLTPSKPSRLSFDCAADRTPSSRHTGKYGALHPLSASRYVSYSPGSRYCDLQVPLSSDIVLRERLCQVHANAVRPSVTLCHVRALHCGNQTQGSPVAHTLQHRQAHIASAHPPFVRFRADRDRAHSSSVIVSNHSILVVQFLFEGPALVLPIPVRPNSKSRHPSCRAPGDLCPNLAASHPSSSHALVGAERRTPRIHYIACDRIPLVVALSSLLFPSLGCCSCIPSLCWTWEPHRPGFAFAGFGLLRSLPLVSVLDVLFQQDVHRLGARVLLVHQPGDPWRLPSHKLHHPGCGPVQRSCLGANIASKVPPPGIDLVESSWA